MVETRSRQNSAIRAESGTAPNQAASEEFRLQRPGRSEVINVLSPDFGSSMPANLNSLPQDADVHTKSWRGRANRKSSIANQVIA